MKKLALVIVLAVVASRLLSVASDENPGRGSPVRDRIAELDRRVTDRLVRLTTDSPDAPKPPKPPKGRRVRSLLVASGLVKAPTMPAWFPKTELEEDEKGKADSSGLRVLVGRLSASEDRAMLDLRKTLEREVGDWLAADVPPSWKPEPRLLDRMALGTYVQPVTRTLKLDSPPADAPGASATPADGLDTAYTLHRAGQQLDFSPGRRAEFVDSYRREIAGWRMKRLGAGLAAALAGLLVLSTYIRTDEATRGYYTNRLRVLAFAGLGAAGFGAYRWLS